MIKPNGLLRELKLRFFEHINYHGKRNGDFFDGTKLTISNKKFLNDFKMFLNELKEMPTIPLKFKNVLKVFSNGYSYKGKAYDIYYDNFTGNFTGSVKQKGDNK
jgi:hypothetical protein